MAGVDMEEVFEQSFELQELLTESEDNGDRMKLMKEYVEKVDNSKLPRVPPFQTDWEWFNVESPLVLTEHLQGKVVVLDFFTYCCINCIHILPDLHALEHKYSDDGLVIVGVHSAKFNNERISSNILSAVLRYGITHPVVNDSKASLWYQMQIQCWPTLVVLGPQNQILLLLMGEGHMETLDQFVEVALDYYKSKEEISNHNIGVKLNRETLPPSPLLFPGKICMDDSGKTLAVADTGHHRVILTDTSGVVQHCIGAGEKGFEDGSFSRARFNSPQGLAWKGHLLYVADTDNHAIRQIDMRNGSVVTLVGTGQQGKDHEGGGQGTKQIISSPWDLTLGSSIESSDLDILYIAMAGTHQIWIYFIEDGKWLKNKEYTKGTCVRFAGSGAEENRNNNYPHAAAFAQPSGLARGAHCLYVADSESSSIRTINTTDGAVKALVGGNRDPRNLFAFGDVDGKGYDAKLQHPLGVALRSQADTETLIVADSYNHKIKHVDVSSKDCMTLVGTGRAGNIIDKNLRNVKLNEPGGLCLDKTHSKLYIADTNNHSIKVLDFNSKQLTELPVLFQDLTSHKRDAMDGNHNVAVETSDANAPIQKSLKRKGTKTAIKVLQEPLHLDPGARVKLQFALTLEEGFHLADEAPSSWQIFTTDDVLDDILVSSSEETEGSLLDLCQQPVVDIHMPSDLPQLQADLMLECRVFYCGDDGACRLKTIVFQQPLHLSTEAIDGEIDLIERKLEYTITVLQK